MTKENKKLRFIMYCRKSTDSEDRQVQSIGDQKGELENIIKRRQLNVVKVFDESKSAKRPGRPLFNEMMDMIEKGEADGILCWKINRLARNPRDGGNIQWFLQEEIIKSIITPHKEYLPTDNVLLMSVELGVATQYSIDLSKDVHRGLLSKAKKGWRPGRAPVGYLNDKQGEQGNKKIFKDEERFDLVKKMWDLLLSRNYTVPEINKIADKEWGFIKRDGKKLSLTATYKMFNNSFYYGEYSWIGEIHQGKHNKMITAEEFDLAQKILGRKGRPRPKHKRLPFNGVIKCSECGGMITSEEKFKKIKSTNEIKGYIYHHCSRRKKDRPCHQEAISHQKLKEQIEHCLDSIAIPPEFLNWALDALRSNNKLEEHNRSKILANHRESYDKVLKRISNLINLYISPDNSDKQLLSEDEFKIQKNGLIKEKSATDEQMKRVSERVDEWMELTEQTFNFATYARGWFEKGDYQTKTQILQALGQNFWLKDGKLTIELQKPLLVLKKGLENTVLEKARLEPSILQLTQTKNSPLGTASSIWSG